MKTKLALFSVVLAVAANAGCKKKDKDQPAATTPSESKPTETKPTETKPTETKPTETKPTAPMTSDEMLAMWKTCMESFSAHDEAKFGACIGDETTMDMLDAPMPASTGKAGIERAKMFWAAFPDIHVAPQLVLASGSSFVSIDLITGTNSGDFMGMPKTDKKVGYLSAHYVQMDMDKRLPKSVLAVIDMGTVMAQLQGDAAHAPMTTGAADAPKLVIAKDDETERANVAAWNKGAEDWNAHDLAKMTAGYADDAVMHDSGEGDVKGAKAIGAEMKGYWDAFPDLKSTYDTVWGAGDYVFALGSGTGTNTGDIKALKLKATGKPVTMKVLEVARFEGGKVKEHWLFMNGMAMATQLGLMPAPGADPHGADPGDGGTKPKMAPDDEGKMGHSKEEGGTKDEKAPATK